MEHGRNHRGDRNSAAEARHDVHDLQTVEALRPGHLDRDRRRIACVSRTARSSNCARPMAAWPRPRRARRMSRPRSIGKPWTAETLARYRCADRAGLPADDRSSRHRCLSAARRRQPDPAAADRNDDGGAANRSVAAMNAPLSRIRGGVHASVSTTAPPAMSMVRRSISTTFRPCRARWKPRWCCRRIRMRASCRIDISAALARRRRRCGRHRGRYSRQERHRADPHRRAAAGRPVWSSMKARSSRRSRRRRSIRRALPRSW